MKHTKNMGRKADPLESTARKLCAEKGKNPDSRIPISSSNKRTLSARGEPRTRPLWTEFRDAAREHLANERSVSDKSRIEDLKKQAWHLPLEIRGSHEYETILQMRECMGHGRVLAGALCADGHVAYSQPVGGVIAYDRQVSISGVGPDIACGNAAIRLDTTLDDIRDRLPMIAADLNNVISFGTKHKKKQVLGSSAPSVLGNPDLMKDAMITKSAGSIMREFGTIGGGNHYLDLFADDEGHIWIGVHFGSRGLGAHVFRTFSDLTGAKDGRHAPANLLDIESDLGKRYLIAMSLAGGYAWEGRLYALEMARRIIGGAVTKTVHNFHNFAWSEKWGRQNAIVVRKGCTPAFPGQEGFVGGSMGDAAVIIEGAENTSRESLLNSTIHGAGRPMARSAAKDAFREEDMRKWMTDRKIILIGGAVDESPMAYRRLDDVLTSHEDTIRVKHRLHPLIVMMAGNDTIDPYKD